MDNECDYAIFDDMAGNFDFFHNYKGWLGGQAEFTLTDKYRGKRKFMWGRPTIMCMNDDPLTCAKVDREWLMENCIICWAPDPFCSVSSSRASTPSTP